MVNTIREGVKITASAAVGVTVGAAQGALTLVPTGLVCAALASVPPANPLLFTTMATTIKIYQGFISFNGVCVIAASTADRTWKTSKATYEFLTDILG